MACWRQERLATAALAAGSSSIGPAYLPLPRAAPVATLSGGRTFTRGLRGPTAALLAALLPCQHPPLATGVCSQLVDAQVAGGEVELPHAAQLWARVRWGPHALPARMALHRMLGMLTSPQSSGKKQSIPHSRAGSAL